MNIPNTPPTAVVNTEVKDKKSSPHKEGTADPIAENSMEEKRINLDFDIFKYTLSPSH